MYTTNHPKGWFLWALAQELAVKAGLPMNIGPIKHPAVDILIVGPMWPVYPDIGANIGIEGNYLFKKNGLPNPSIGDTPFLTLREFVEGSFAQYVAYPPEVFKLPAVNRITTASGF